jgi:hypothetical protein
VAVIPTVDRLVLTTVTGIVDVLVTLTMTERVDVAVTDTLRTTVGGSEAGFVTVVVDVCVEYTVTGDVSVVVDEIVTGTVNVVVAVVTIGTVEVTVADAVAGMTTVVVYRLVEVMVDMERKLLQNLVALRMLIAERARLLLHDLRSRPSTSAGCGAAAVNAAARSSVSKRIVRLGRTSCFDAALQGILRRREGQCLGI